MQHGVIQLVRPTIRQKLVQNHAQCVDITSQVNLVRIAPRLLRAHIGNGPLNLPHGRHYVCHRDIDIRNPCQSEIKHFGMPVRIHDDIGWFQVTMNDATLMGVIDGVTQFAEQS